MPGPIPTRQAPDLLRARLSKKIDELTAAFDREASRRHAMRDRLAQVDPEVLLAAIDCMGSAEKAAAWLTSPEYGLGNEYPLDAAGTAEGKERVLQLLWRQNLGMFSPAAGGA